MVLGAYFEHMKIVWDPRGNLVKCCYRRLKSAKLICASLWGVYAARITHHMGLIKLLVYLLVFFGSNYIDSQILDVIIYTCILAKFQNFRKQLHQIKKSRNRINLCALSKIKKKLMYRVSCSIDVFFF